MRLLLGLLVLVLFAGTARAYDCSSEKYKKDYATADRAFRLGILGIPRDNPSGNIMVDEAYWRTLTFNQKSELADTIVCAVSGAGKSMMRLNLLSNMTGKVLGSWYIGALTVP